MSSLTLINNFVQVSDPIDRTLTSNYFKAKFANFFESLFSKALDKVRTSAIVNTQQLTNMLYHGVYLQANELDPEVALSLLPTFEKVKNHTWKQRERYKEIDFMDSHELKAELHKLVQVANGTVSRLHGAAYANAETEPMPEYFKEKMKKNRNRIMANALSEETYS